MRRVRSIGAVLAPFLLVSLVAATAQAASVVVTFDDITNQGTPTATITLNTAASGPPTPGPPLPGSGTVDFDATGATLLGWDLIFGLHSSNADFGFASQDVTGTDIQQTSTNSYATATVAGAGAQFDSVVSTGVGGLFSCVGTFCGGVDFPPSPWGVPPPTETSIATFFLDTFTDANTFTGRIEHVVISANTSFTEFYSFTSVPEPGTLLLMGSGLLGLTFFRGRGNH